uniref:Centrosomal protein of 170 kDa protein B-like n=1 Tax=Cyprinus carpio TaxID=7962 RepID=A0A8C2I218_CYPCA
MKIRDHVTKLSVRKHRNPSKESIARLPEVMSVENKVSDWLVQSDATMMKSLEEQSGSHELLNKTFKDAHHLEDPDFEEPEEAQMVQSMSHSVSQKIDQHPDGEDYPNNYTPDSKSQAKPDPKQSFVIEIFDDTQGKKRSQSFTNNMCSPDFQSALKSKLDKRKNGERSTSSGNNPPTQQFTIPLKGSDGPQRAGSLRREKTEIRMSTSDFSSRSASKTFGSVGRRSKLSQDFAAELLRVSKPSPAPTWDVNSTWVKTPSSNAGSSVTHQSFPTSSHTVSQSVKSPSAHIEDNSTEAETLVPKQQEEDDSLSDAGTYTIEAESQDKEVVEARSLIDQMQSMTTLTPGGTKWVSRWASLADTYSDSGPASGLFDIPTHADLSTGGGERIIHQVMLNRRSDYSESGQSSRSRRVLPQVPSKEKIETPPPKIHIQPDSYLSGVEKSSQDQKQKWDPQKLSVQDDLDPDSLSDASKSDDGSVVEQCRKTPDMTQKTWNRSTKTGQEEAKDQDSPTKFSTATLTRQQGKFNKSNCSPPNIDQPDDSLGGDNSVSIVRQESYTKERASDNIHLSRLPQISSQTSSKDAFKGVSNKDTQSYLKDTEDVLASLEAKLLEQQQQGKNGRSHLEDSFSGESDTSSTISGKNVSVSVPRKPVVLRGLLRGSREPKTSDDPSSEKSQSGIKDSNGKTDPKHFLLRRNLSSLDFGADVQSPTTRHWPDAVSDQESSSLPYKKYTVPLQKEGSSKSKVHNALARSSSLSAPKPTRASMLRRARLGEASDNEGAETDRTSQNSDVNPSANNRGAQESKKLSRLDILALPRKRTSSFNTPSDTESSTSRTGFSNRSTDSGNSVRKASVLDPKALLRKVSNAVTRQPIIRGRSSSAKYASSTASSRRRQKGSDYASTSEDEYESNHSTPKHKRSHHSGSQQNPRIHPAGPVRAMPRSRDSEGEGHESDAFQNWTSHSAEIARLSQDLAKDLAILAQEIHDVAGDTEAQSVPTDKTGPAISTHEELLDQIPEAGLNFQKESPAAVPADESEQIVSNRQSLRADELTLNDMMLNPVSQLSLSIRENTEQLTEKIKALFHNKMDVLGEIEAKINKADDSPPMKTSNKEIASILRELRRVQKQLEVINTVIDPRGNPDLSRTLASAGVHGSRAASHRRVFRSTDRESPLM